MKKTPKNSNAEDTRKLNAFLKKKGELRTFRQAIGQSFAARRGRPTKAVAEQRREYLLDDTDENETQA